MPVDNRHQLILQTGNADKSFFLFHQKDFKDIDFDLYEIDLATGTFKKYVIVNYIPFLPTHLETTKNGALVGGYFLGRIPVILYFDFQTLKSKVLAGLFNEPGELIQIKVNEDQGFNILINAKNYSKQKTLWIKTYDSGGNLLQNVTLKPEENNSLLFGRIITLDKENQIVGGVYGNRNSDFSRGLFLAHIDPEFNQQLYYYPFIDLENFFKYMKSKRENRIKERIARKRVKGKKIRFQYRFLIHEFVPYRDEYILLGEAFYPRYKPLERNYYGLAPGAQLIFDGYQYTHAIIIGFDASGKLLWDNSFEINDVKSFTLEQFVKMDAQESKIALLYLFKDKIRSKIIQDNVVLEGKIYNQLKLQFDDTFSPDNVNINKLDYWYEDNFLAYGTQHIPYQRFKGQAKEVFFVNKLRYD